MTKSPCPQEAKNLEQRNTQLMATHNVRSPLQRYTQGPARKKEYHTLTDRRVRSQKAFPLGEGWKAGLRARGHAGTDHYEQRNNTCKDTETKGLTQQGAWNSSFSEFGEDTRKWKEMLARKVGIMRTPCHLDYRGSEEPLNSWKPGNDAVKFGNRNTTQWTAWESLEGSATGRRDLSEGDHRTSRSCWLLVNQPLARGPKRNLRIPEMDRKIGKDHDQFTGKNKK